jgi:hypothetical protein
MRTSPDLKLIPAEHRFNGLLFAIALFSSIHSALESSALRLRPFIFHTNDLHPLIDCHGERFPRR